MVFKQLHVCCPVESTDLTEFPFSSPLVYLVQLPVSFIITTSNFTIIPSDLNLAVLDSIKHLKKCLRRTKFITNEIQLKT